MSVEINYFSQSTFSYRSIPMDIFETSSSLLMILCSAFGTVCALIFILIVAIHRQCQTLNILLVLNSILDGLIANVTCMCQSIYQLIDVGNDVLCSFRGFILQSGTGLLYHSLCLQAFHRLIVTVYSTRRSLQTKRFNIVMVALQWLISCTFGLPFFLPGGIKYDAGSRICQVKTKLILSIWSFFNI
jgi:hypothetical protein